ncbi:WD40/YVTN/BNR-like repeat-containing protein [Sediminibacterium soli]|uniref:WD40/YVTN/BNR-like repeat-containing protein n=1 Tax=Sediminibacterium soli TaxID=2698829 RepID=UPI00137AFF44|nr:YCF48-related protein [Sediminibacterium soli]NCI46494.1 oxidoreductase [Sediminibacterium soli]
MKTSSGLKCLFLFSLLLIASALVAQPGIHMLQSGKPVSFRGLSVVSDKIIWASGSSGTVVRSVDGGANWEWITVPGYEKRDFRDIEAFDADTAVIMGIAEPAVILKTVDGGKNWEKVFEDHAKGVFLDAMAFTPGSGLGIAIGDPLEGTNTPYQVITHDNGSTWKKVSMGKTTLQEGEAFFASSGSNLVMIGNHPIIVSGGRSSRILFADWSPLPIVQGGESTGANSVAVYRARYGIVVGGDFAKDTISTDNCVLFDIGDHAKLTIRKPKSDPHGYRSSVVYLSRKKLLTCGTSGVDLSGDGGDSWTLLSKEGFHVCQKAKKGKAVFLAGGNGKIARLEGTF